MESVFVPSIVPLEMSGDSVDNNSIVEKCIYYDYITYCGQRFLRVNFNLIVEDYLTIHMKFLINTHNRGIFEYGIMTKSGKSLYLDDIKIGVFYVIKFRGDIEISLSIKSDIIDEKIKQIQTNAANGYIVKVTDCGEWFRNLLDKQDIDNNFTKVSLSLPPNGHGDAILSLEAAVDRNDTGNAAEFSHINKISNSSFIMLIASVPRDFIHLSHSNLAELL